jgi:hypothetical protein
MNDSQQDDRIFDRLVDGELSDADRKVLLESLDTMTEGWRRCAVAFLEAQAWRDGLRQFLRGPALKTVASEPVATAVPAGHDLLRSRRRAMTWLAIAASLMLAVTFAITQRRGPEQPASSDLAVETNPASPIEVISPESAPAQANVGDMLTFWVRDESGQSRPLRVPLVDADPLDRELGVSFQSGLPDRVRSQLQDRGYQVQSKRRYAPFTLENGRRMIVPVEDTKIVPVSQNVY